MPLYNNMQYMVSDQGIGSVSVEGRSREASAGDGRRLAGRGQDLHTPALRSADCESLHDGLVSKVRETQKSLGGPSLRMKHSPLSTRNV